MSKTIEEAAKQAIIDNNYFMADPNHPEFVDRGLEQMRACKWVINHIFSLPLASRMTAEEKERVRRIYEADKRLCEEAKDSVFRWSEIYKGRYKLLESIFGKDFFQGGGMIWQ